PGDTDKKAAGGESASAVPAPPEAPALDARTHGWEGGRVYAYRLKVTSTMTLGAEGNAFDFDLTGLGRLVARTATPEATTLYASVTDIKATSRVPDSQAEFDKVATQIGEAGCFFTLSGGRVSELRVPQGGAATVINVYRQIASALQFARTVRDVDR